MRHCQTARCLKMFLESSHNSLASKTCADINFSLQVSFYEVYKYQLIKINFLDKIILL